MGKKLQSVVEVLHANGGVEPVCVDVQDRHWLANGNVQEGTDALNLFAEGAVDEPDVIKGRAERRDPLLAVQQGGFPIPCQGDVEDVLGCARHHTQDAVHGAASAAPPVSEP
jgi:hypothetical protein